MNTVIIVAGGSGRRMQSDRPKQYLELEGLPILCRTLMKFTEAGLIDRIVLVVPEEDRAFCRDILIPRVASGTPIGIVPGGSTRQASVFNGLASLNVEDEDLVVIHDGVRPFLQAAELEACIRTAAETGACILARPVSDTIKKANSEGRITATLDRDGLWLAQTPQTFRYRLIMDAHARARSKGISATDDASLLETDGHPVGIVPGSRLNIKITTPADLPLAAAILNCPQGGS